MKCTCAKNLRDDDPARKGCVFCNPSPGALLGGVKIPASVFREDRTVPVFVREGYDSLFAVLCKALHQAQDGKGKERHAQPDQAFEDQPIIQIGRMVGMGFQTGQAIKKAVEAQGMFRRGDFNAAEREILGAINYLAAVAIEINQRATAKLKDQ